ncbi:MAG: hypothetical protein ABIE42_03870 [Candidatus Eisenbacteria bacterium]
MTDRKWTIVAAIILVVIGVAASGAAMRVLLGHAQDHLIGDEGPYAGIARSLAAGEGYTRHGVPTTMRAPGMVLYLVLPHLLGEPPVPLLRWYAALPIVLLSLVAFLIWRRVGFPVRRSFVLALPFALYPMTLANSGLVISEALLPIVLLPWIALVLTEPHDSTWTVVLAGILGGIAVLTRLPLIPAALVFPPIYMLVRARKDTRRRKKLALRRAAVYVALVILVFLPWPIRNYCAFGELVLTTNKAGVDLWKSNNPDATGVTFIDHGETFAPHEETIKHLPEIEMGQAARREAVKFIRENPGRFATLAAIRQAEYWKPFSRRGNFFVNAAAGGPYLLLILAFGYFLATSRRRPGTASVLWGTVALAILVAAPFLAYPALVRYRLPVDIAMLWTVLFVLGTAGFPRRK